MARTSEYPINDLILNRWSPRALTGEAITKEQLMSLFEAARWAPSSYNNQPWKFVYAMRDTEHWDKLFNLLGEFNQSWCKNASALIVVISAQNFAYNNKPSRTHQFDTGAAWENLALQASSQNLIAHGMEGFDYDKAKTELDIPEDHDVMAMVAIGKQADKSTLPAELQEKEVMSDRKPVAEFVMEGSFNK